jgi:hypothetical protein
LFPFTWWHVLIPILPRPLIDIVDAPVPILIGISNATFDQVQNMITEHEESSYVWVVLDQGLIYRCDSSPVVEPDFLRLSGVTGTTKQCAT